MGGTDLRIERTRLALRNALLALIAEKCFDAITVQEIADQAMITRATFYNHYRDKYALLEQVIPEMIRKLAAPIETLLQSSEEQSVLTALVRCLEHVARHASFYRAVLEGSGDVDFGTQVVRYLETTVQNESRRQRINLRFITAGFLGLTVWWLEQKPPVPVNEIATQLHLLLNTAMRMPMP